MGHTYANILIHVVFSTKRRASLIRRGFRDRLFGYMGALARDEIGDAIAIGGTDNHVHGLLSFPTTLCVADGMRKWKTLSARWTRKTISGAFDFAWQTGYSAFSVSPRSTDGLVRYIEHQAEHHKGQTFEEELIGILESHGVDYDPDHLWD